jgi:hypothetical protein
VAEKVQDVALTVEVEAAATFDIRPAKRGSLTGGSGQYAVGAEGVLVVWSE